MKKGKIIAIVVVAILVGFCWMTASAQGLRTVLRIDSVKITRLNAANRWNSRSP